jgi:ankyrin repeat protein
MDVMVYSIMGQNINIVRKLDKAMKIDNISHLHVAASLPDMDILNIFLERAKYNHLDENGETALFPACRSGRINNVLLLLKKCDPRIANNNNLTVVSILCEKILEKDPDPAYLSILRIISKKNKDININLLFEMVDNNKSSVLKLLLNKKNINMKNNDGDTMLHVAVRNKNKKMIQLLIEFGAGFNIKNKQGLTSKKMIELSKIVL